jgi:hypothetical protein
LFNWLKKKIENASTDAMANDLERFIRMLKGADDSAIALLLVVANKFRLELIEMGEIPEAALDLRIYRDEQTQMECDTCTIKLIRRIGQFQQLNEPANATGLMLWVHSIRALNVPEIRFLGKEMWREIDRGFPYIEEEIENWNAISGENLPESFAAEARFIPIGLDDENKYKEQHKTEVKPTNLRISNLDHVIKKKEVDEKRGNTKEIHSVNADIKNTEKILGELGYDILQPGIEFAKESLEGGYSPAETASGIALIALAQDARVATGPTKLSGIPTHAELMIEILTEFRDDGLIADELFGNDSKALLMVATPSPEQTNWIDTLLSDATLANAKLAKSRLDYETLPPEYPPYKQKEGELKHNAKHESHSIDGKLVIDDEDENYQPEDAEAQAALQGMKGVEGLVKQLGYRISDYGVALALLSLQSGYSPAETASQLVLGTIARDAKAARDNFDLKESLGIAAHVRAIVDFLTMYKDKGLIREELFRNDVNAMLKIAMLGPEASQWIDKVLGDPMLAKERVATSQVSYKKLAE